MGKINYKLELPPVLDENNQPLAAEESEASLREPWPIQITVNRAGVSRTYTVLCDLNNADSDALDAYEAFKAQRYAIYNPGPRKVRNSKLTHLKEDEGDSEDVTVSGEQAIKSAALRSKERAVFFNLLFPKDWQENPVILASNLPDIPTDETERHAWFERGGILACEVMDAVVMAIDPTGPLAQEKASAAKARELESQMMTMMEEKLAEIQNLSLVPPEGQSPEVKVETPVENTTLSENSGLPSDDAGAGESSDALSSSPTETP